ncbi:MAG: hypothetical protein PsegKO_19270 [Pseudohongiellaceae bacterium]
MNKSSTPQDPVRKPALPLAFLGGFIGLVLSYGVLSGDNQGQVNLLFLLLLFVVVPMFALLLSLLLVVRPGGRGLVGWILEMPFTSPRLRREYLQRDLIGDRKAWLVYQTQFFSLGFSLGSLFLYLFLLLATDISFIWRSTLLEAEQVLPALNLIALPWAFWGEAQASLSLLEQTRDFRLLPADQSETVVGLWWRYVLAAQVCYSLLPRTLLLVLAGYVLRRRGDRDLQPGISGDRIRPKPMSQPLAELAGEAPRGGQLLDWAGLPEHIAQTVNSRYQPRSGIQSVKPDTIYADLDAAGADVAIVVLVKAWEPPLAELADFLKTIPGAAGRNRLLLPLDWNRDKLQAVNSSHLQEWRRFAATLETGEKGRKPPWQVLQLRQQP